MKQKILLHICCAPDGLYVINLLRENYKICGYYYNPNIHPLEEYQLRLQETRKIMDKINITLIEEIYDKDYWFQLTDKFKQEPEKGMRCNICYAMRLKKTAQKAAQLNFDIYSTVMSVSPWKKADVLNRIGRMFGRKYHIDFLEANFKKKDGFKKSVELSKEYEMYRQNYCGCLYSKRNS
ncbi:MAG: epoxyqueuosine reductase QueH [Candidatus Aminicenantaceae bacterium]